MLKWNILIRVYLTFCLKRDSFLFSIIPLSKRYAASAIVTFFSLGVRIVPC